MPEVLASALAREHAEELVRLEVDEIKRLRRTYEQARKEVLARLSQMPGDTFTAQQLRSVQVQIEAGLQGMVKTLKADASAGIESLTTQGIEQTIAEIAWWDTKFRGGATQRIAGEAARKVLKPQALLLHKYEASIDAYGMNLISEMQGRLGVHLVKNSSWREMSLDIAGKLETNAIQGARWRAERIVRTEVVDALSLGHMAGLEQGAELLPGLKGQWDSTLDKRTSRVCMDFNGRVREIGQPFGTYNGRPILRPPAIPNCRSRVVPWHAEWAEHDETIDPKSAPKPVVRKHEPGPKPVTKTKKKKSRRQRLMNSVRREERVIQNRRTEHARVFDSDGTVLLKKTSGRRNYVSFTNTEVALCRGRVFTHNHPTGTSFSNQDVLAAMHHGLAEMRAVGSRGYVHSLKPRPDRPWSQEFFDRSVMPAIERHSAAVHREQMARIHRGTLTREEAAFRHQHLVWTRVAREVGLIYSRRKVAP